VLKKGDEKDEQVWKGRQRGPGGGGGGENPRGVGKLIPLQNKIDAKEEAKPVETRAVCGKRVAKEKRKHPRGVQHDP